MAAELLMMTPQFTPAAAEGVPVIVGISGPSRSGKTYSALRIATGIADGDAQGVFGICTERGRMGLYARRFNLFPMHRLEPPFSYARYGEAMDAAVAAGAKCVIVDSLSHAHEGEGGMIDQHDAELDRLAGQDFGKRQRANFTAWIAPKRELGRFVQQAMRVPVPMIFCFRAKDKLKVKPGKQPESLGFRPICSDELTFEMTAMLALPENAQGVPDLDAPATGLREPFGDLVRRGEPLDEALGERIAEYARGTAPAATPDDPTPAMRKTTELIETVRAAPDMPGLAAAWAEVNTHRIALGADNIAALEAEKDERKAQLEGENQ